MLSYKVHLVRSRSPRETVYIDGVRERKHNPNATGLVLQSFGRTILGTDIAVDQICSSILAGC